MLGEDWQEPNHAAKVLTLRVIFPERVQWHSHCALCRSSEDRGTAVLGEDGEESEITLQMRKVDVGEDVGLSSDVISSRSSKTASFDNGSQGKGSRISRVSLSLGVSVSLSL